MRKTIRVVPRAFLRNPRTGETASLFGAKPPGFEVCREGYTWERVDSRGEITRGLCRVPAKTRTEADSVARAYASKFGYTLVE